MTAEDASPEAPPGTATAGRGTTGSTGTDSTGTGSTGTGSTGTGSTGAGSTSAGTATADPAAAEGTTPEAGRADARDAGSTESAAAGHDVTEADAPGSDVTRDATEAAAAEAAGTETPAGAETPAGTETPAGGAPRQRGATLLSGALAVLLVAAVVAAVFLGMEARRLSELERQRAEAVRTARQLVVDFLTHDYRSFERTQRNVLALSSGDFAEQYRASARKLRDFIREVRSVSEGEVLEAGVVSFDPDSARVLVVADADVTNVATETPQPRHYRIQVDLSREEAGWRVVDLTFVG